MAVTEDQVTRIILFDTARIPEVQPFIDDAVIMLTNIIGTALDTATFDLVTRYMAAHLIAISDPRVNMEKVKSLQVRYDTKLDKGLGITHFGTMAMMLDSSGKLSQWNTQVVSGEGLKQFFWAGETVV
jgi:hypothetical protein